MKYIVKMHGQYYTRCSSMRLFGYYDEGLSSRLEDAWIFQGPPYRNGRMEAFKAAKRLGCCATVLEANLTEGSPRVT